MYNVFTKSTEPGQFIEQATRNANLINGVLQQARQAVVVYHDKSNDGITAAATVRAHLLNYNEHSVARTDFLPVTHDAEYIAQINRLIEDGERDYAVIVFAGFCPTPQVMNVLTRSYFVIVIDNHENPLSDILRWHQDSDDKTKSRCMIFADEPNTMSGAMMAYNLFIAPFNQRTINCIDRYERFDKSQGDWEQAQTVASYIKYLIATNPGSEMTLIAVTAFVSLPGNEAIDTAMEYGVNYKKTIEVLAYAALSESRQLYDAAGNRCAVMFTADKTTVSDICDTMRNVDTYLYFAVAVVIQGTKIAYSVRSTELSPITAKEIAEIYGGGGHTHAAGFTAPFHSLAEVSSQLMNMVLAMGSDEEHCSDHDDSGCCEPNNIGFEGSMIIDREYGAMYSCNPNLAYPDRPSATPVQCLPDSRALAHTSNVGTVPGLRPMRRSAGNLTTAVTSSSSHGGCAGGCGGGCGCGCS